MHVDTVLLGIRLVVMRVCVTLSICFYLIVAWLVGFGLRRGRARFVSAVAGLSRAFPRPSDVRYFVRGLFWIVPDVRQGPEKRPGAHWKIMDQK